MGPHDGGGQDKNKDLGGLSFLNLPTTPEVALGVGRDHWLAPYSGLEIGTGDQLKLALFSCSREYC